MPQTPKSVSALLTGNNQSNIVYTVPAGTTAVVKSILGSSVDNGSYQYGVLKTSGGIQYPVSWQNTPYTVSSGGTTIYNYNLINSPITLTAGERIDMAISNQPQFKFPENNTPLVDQYGNTPTITDIIFANSIYMAVGQLGNFNAGYCATSTDGITWTQQTAASNYGQITDLTYMSGSTMWVAIAGGSLIFSTNNGSTWTSATTVPTGTGLTPYQLASSSSLIGVYAASGTTSNIWYSTNGSTWTAATTFAGSLLPGGNTPYSNCNGISWSGTAFIISQYCSSQITTDFVNYQFLGCAQSYNLGYALGAGLALTYSSAYSRYYMTGGNSNANKSISVSNNANNSNLWQWATTCPAVEYSSVQCAGSNTVLIATPNTSSTVRAKSTDGVNFTAASDVRGWSGFCLGLANGQFYTFQSNGNSSMYVSTDPIVSTGTQLNTQGTTFYAQCGAADPSSGAWVIMGNPSGATNQSLSGATATTGGASLQNLNTVMDQATEGYITDVCWSSSDSKFYCITQKGRIYSATTATIITGAWVFVVNGFATSYTVDQICNIRAVGSNIYVTGSSYTNVIYVATIATSPSFVGYNTPNIYAGITNRKNSSIYQVRGCSYMASNGTNVVIGNAYLRLATIVPANNRTFPSSFPSGVARTDTVNGIQFSYGGIVDPSYSTGGIYASTNAATDFGFSSTLQGMTSGTQFPQQQRITYVSSNYYFSAAANVTIWLSSTHTSFTTQGAWATSQSAGVNSVTPNYVASNGTNAVYYQGGGNQFRVSVTPLPSRYAAAVTLGLVEIT